MEKTPTFTFLIQSVDGRPVWEERMRPQLEASDVGTNYQRLVFPANGKWEEHFHATLDAMCDAKTDFVVRMEDDCILVNKYLLHNLQTWPALNASCFGAGWGYRPSCVPGWNDRWWFGALPGSLCTVFRVSDMPFIRDFCLKTNRPQDIAMSEAVGAMKRETCVHGISLVEHDRALPSTFGHVHGVEGSSCGRFHPDWRR